MKNPFTKPRALQKGDLIGVIAPSSPCPLGPLRAGIRYLQGRGFRTRLSPGLPTRRKGFLAGEDSERAEELRLMFEDPEVRAVFVTRGGYGAQRLLPRLDPQIITRNPKIFMGYSDVTSILFFITERCGLVSFHGPVVTEMGFLAPWTEHYLFRSLMHPQPVGEVPLGRARWIRKGRARGPLLGGNLSIFCSLLGTANEPNTSGKVLFFEDRGEKPYRIDRMLVQLRQAGMLNSAAAVLFGDLFPGTATDLRPRERRILKEVLFDHLLDLGVPVVWGLPIGHGRKNLVVPLGVPVEVNGAKNSLALQASGVDPPA